MEFGNIRAHDDRRTVAGRGGAHLRRSGHRRTGAGWPVAAVIAPPAVEPVAAGLPLEEIATNPEAQYPDPLVNGAAAGALAGAAGSGVLSGVSCLPGFIVAAIPCAIIGAANGAVWGTLIGVLVGVVSPESVPQVLP